jgi:DNA ligase (NAD+)
MKDEPTIAAYGLLFKLELAKTVDLWRAISALGIRLVGAESAKLIASQVSDFNDLLNFNPEQLRSLTGIGDAVIDAVNSFLTSEPGIQVISSWLRAGLKPKPFNSVISGVGPLSGSQVLVTGTLRNFDRDGAKEAILRAGGKPASGVSKNLSFAVVGDGAGSQKLAKLSDLGIEIVDEDEFIRRLRRDEVWEPLEDLLS